MTYEAVVTPAVQTQAPTEVAERTTAVDYVKGRVCFTCGEAYVGVTDKACPFCGSTILADLRWPGGIGGE
jgi:hypothetical protein